MLEPGGTMKFLFDAVGRNTGEYTVKVVWGWRETANIMREKEDTLPNPISVQEPSFAFNLSWILIIGSIGGGIAYAVYHARRKMRQMERETDAELNPDSDK